MKIQNFKRIIRENFKEEYGELVDGLGLSLNGFAESIITAMSGYLNDDNINQITTSVDVIVDATGKPRSATDIKATIKGKIIGTQVIKCENLTNSNGYLSTAPFITYTDNGGLLRVNHITGLISNNKYRLTVRVFGS
jgi:hypothetical protein